MLRGRLDEVSATRIAGWAQETDRPESPVSLVLTAGDRLVTRIVANVYRRDLEVAGIGNGRFGFDVALRGKTSLGPLSGLEPCLVRVFGEIEGGDLENSPFLFEPAFKLDENVRDRISTTLIDDADTDELVDRVTFLATLSGRLVDKIERQRSGGTAREEHRLLRHRWVRRLDGLNEAPDAFQKPRVLVVGPELGSLANDSHRRSMLSLMRSFRRSDYHVAFVDINAAGSQEGELRSAGIEVCRKPFIGSVEETLRQRGGGLSLVVLQGERVASCYLPLVRFHCPKAKVIYSVGHLASVRMSRQAQTHRIPELHHDCVKVMKAEMAVAAAVDLVVTQSKVEAEHFTANRHVHIIRPSIAPERDGRSMADRAGVAFIGSQSQASNRDAVRWLLSEIMPLVWKQAPQITLSIVGKSVVTNLRLPRDPRVIQVGEVASLSPILNTVRLTICPLAFGSGLKGSVLQSLAAGVPCVCTPIAAEGIGLEKPLLDLVGKDAGDLADVLAAAYCNPARLATLSEAALCLITNLYGQALEDSSLSKAISSLSSKVGFPRETKGRNAS